MSSQDGHVKAVANDEGEWITYTWDGDLIKTIDYNMENLTLSFEYGKEDSYLDNQAVDLEYLIHVAPIGKSAPVAVI